MPRCCSPHRASTPTASRGAASSAAARREGSSTSEKKSVGQSASAAQTPKAVCAVFEFDQALNGAENFGAPETSARRRRIASCHSASGAATRCSGPSLWASAARHTDGRRKARRRSSRSPRASGLSRPVRKMVRLKGSKMLEVGQASQDGTA